MAELKLQHLDKIYDNKVQAVYDFNLDVKDGEFIVNPSQKDWDSGDLRLTVASVGQKVIIRDYAGTTVKLEGEEYIVVRQDDILAIVE